MIMQITYPVSVVMESNPISKDVFLAMEVDDGLSVRQNNLLLAETATEFLTTLLATHDSVRATPSQLMSRRASGDFRIDVDESTLTPSSHDSRRQRCEIYNRPEINPHPLDWLPSFHRPWPSFKGYLQLFEIVK